MMVWSAVHSLWTGQSDRIPAALANQFSKARAFDIRIGRNMGNCVEITQSGCPIGRLGWRYAAVLREGSE